MNTSIGGLLFTALLLVSCRKEQPPPVPVPEAKKVVAAPAPVPVTKPVPKKDLPPVPQGKLPQMDPEKAKFIAAPSTPQDEEIKKAAKPADEAKK